MFEQSLRISVVFLTVGAVGLAGYNVIRAMNEQAIVHSLLLAEESRDAAALERIASVLERLDGTHCD